jgi:hypothetical protein
MTDTLKSTQIQKDYTSVCAQIGQLVVVRENIPSQLAALIARAQELDKAYGDAIKADQVAATVTATK